MNVESSKIFSDIQPKYIISKRQTSRPGYEHYVWAVNLDSYLLREGKTKRELARYFEVPYITVQHWCFLRLKINPHLAKKIAKYLNTEYKEIFNKEFNAKGYELTPIQKQFYVDAKRIYEQTGSISKIAKKLNVKEKDLLEEMKKIKF